MVHIVFFTLFGTGIADFCAGATEGSGVVATDGHQLRRGETSCRTFTVQLNTFAHHCDVLFTEAHRCAMVAFGGAFQARVDAGLKFLVTHSS